METSMADQRGSNKRVAVCGGGLVGALNACFLAKRGFTVELFEMRPDIRTQEVVKGRSINLALSVRGREALKRVGLEDRVIQKGIPMYSRMIHDRSGTLRQIPYGKGQQNIMSVDRRLLNEVLLDAAEQYSNVKTHFNHKVVRCDFQAGEIVFLHEGQEVKKTVDLIVGADGAFSAVRQQMMKRPELLFDLQQHYIPHGYMELNIPPTQDGQFAMGVNHLHIWPRNDFMMIALPNLDKSYTTTLFMPFDKFNSLQTEDQLLGFFRETFPDSLPLLGESSLKKTFFQSKALPLVTVKCHPYHVGNKAVIIGDAAHAMVPFYGQGMNCGFEDCIVLDSMLEEYNNDFAKALPAYTELRNPDAKAICDLALYNYIEMRASVNSRLFLFRKKLDNLLHWAFPSFWVPLYTSVSFSRMRYHQCIANRAWQDKILTNICLGAGGALAASVLVALYTQMGSRGNGALPQLVSQLSGALSSLAQRVFP
ncbi:kynurenine 3-monooxygenase-like [Babylonia areolata]|uniref:kynurenine 3-monooxygenase-like n=1 Tax=Babylonia areolata TaxID=304850 RepID=UPI003FD4AC6E